MFRSCARALQSLPFVPMALSTLDTLKQRMEAMQPRLTDTPKASRSLTKKAAAAAAATSAAPTTAMTTTVGGTKRRDQLQWFSAQCPSPFFISPKHDGVRLISYVPPSARSDAQAKSRSATSRTSSSTLDVNVRHGMTCYSRYGRPIYGLFWIEEELRLLRAVCGDALLIVDGELYLHQTHMDRMPTPSPRAGNAARKSPAKSHKASRTKKDGVGTTSAAAPSPSSSAETFKTGFLAVSALVHRLRGSSSQCATEEDILHYVPTLPHLCVFDIPSYSPCADALSAVHLSSASAWPQRASAPAGLKGTSVKEQRAITAELQRVRHDVMHHLGIRDVEQLRVVPNTTPFSQRLRTMHFLFLLLESAMASPVLCRHFCPSQLSRPGRPPAAHGEVAMQYQGGRFIRRIPYELATSLEDATQRILPLYLRHHYEGAVLRSPMNTYDFKEKRNGVIAALVAPLLRANPPASSPGGRQKRLQGQALRGKRDRDVLFLSCGGLCPTSATGKSRPLMVRAYPNGSTSVEPLAPVTPATAPLTESERDAVDAVTMGESAVRRAKQLPTRSETAVKVLAYQDREYAILRPLLKEPSKNPNTRVLVSIPRSAVSALGYPIKPDTDTMEEEKGSGKGEGGAATPPRKKSLKAVAAVADSPVVVFYGLQCLADNGLVFNVSMPKLTLAQQKALLNHLLAAGKRSPSHSDLAKSKGKATGQRMASLTGLYATVKFSTLTEHGLPRFGTVKAIRGGKGWFM